MIAPPIQTI